MQRCGRRRAVLAAGFLVVTSSARLASAQPDDQAIAADLFDRGVKLRDKGRCDDTPVKDVEACKEAREHFTRAYALSPKSLGALRNLAYVEKGLGLTASSARHFRELARKAPHDPQPERQLWAQFATKEADALEPRVPHLQLRVPKDHPRDLTITLDGAAIPEPAWGAALDVDPGDHTVRATASGAPPFSANVNLGEGTTKSLDVDVRGAGAPPSTTPPGAVEPPPATPGSRPETGTAEPSSRSLVPLFVGVGGVAVAGAGLVFGLAAKSSRDSNCDVTTKLCPSDSSLDGAKGLALASTIFTIAGAAVAVAGFTWYFLQPTSASRSSASAWVTASPASIGAGGTF